MKYLDRLKSKKKAPRPTAKTVKSQNKAPEQTVKTVKTSFGTFDSTPGRHFSGNQLKIEPMEICLYGNKCFQLDAPGDRRPMCKATGVPVFDLKRCPKGWWL